MSLLVNLSVLVAVVYLIARIKFRSFFDLADKIPGYNTIQAHKVIRKLFSRGPENFYRGLLELGEPFSGSAFKIQIGPFLNVVVRDAEDVKTVLNVKDCNEKHVMYKRFFDNGLVVSGGEEHKLRKKMASPIFSPAVLRTYLPIMRTRTKMFLQKFEVNRPRKEFNILHTIFNFSLDINLSTLMGRTDIKDETRSQFVEDVAA